MSSIFRMHLEPVTLGDLNHGDHIAVKRKFEELVPAFAADLVTPFVTEDGCYCHHGIFINDHIDKLAVIDFSGQTKTDAKPRLRQIMEFLSGCSDGDLFRVVYEDPSEYFSVDETVRKAREAVEQGNTWPSYHIFNNNCESFATFMKTGKAVSVQVIRGLQRIKTATAAKLRSSIIGSLQLFGKVKKTDMETVMALHDSEEKGF
eukprot:Seg9474.1 transcript_id=Seg9474.1/GoldUCD/mRNA.D3Y31 product="Phospholipid-metabolizing enzyme A-C1" protein_id=Seg9474.1/GoldUCD/D3Y31